MTRFEELKNMDIEALAEWLDKYGQFEGSPWLERFDRLYCRNCDAIMCHYPDSEYEFPCSWCEINGKCKYFLEMDWTPDNRDMIKAWLESKVED